MQHPKYAALNRPLLLAAAGASVTSGPIDVQEAGVSAHSQSGDIVAIVDVPALTTAQLPDTKTVSYYLLESNNTDLSSPITNTTMGVQTGAGGAGAPAQTFAARPKAAGGKFLGLKISSSSGCGTINTFLVALQILSQRVGS